MCQKLLSGTLGYARELQNLKDYILPRLTPQSNLKFCMFSITDTTSSKSISTTHYKASAAFVQLSISTVRPGLHHSPHVHPRTLDGLESWEYPKETWENLKKKTRSRILPNVEKNARKTKESLDRGGKAACWEGKPCLGYCCHNIYPRLK